jgi:hypothetical protein
MTWCVGESVLLRSVYRGRVRWALPQSLVVRRPPGALRRTRLGFDTRDQALDVVVEPDGTWQWKDEDQLTGWEGWRPDPAWPPPMLSRDWNA